MRYDETLTDDEIETMVSTIEPTWAVEAATAATAGAHAVYRLDVATPTGPRECVLKATPPEKDPTSAGEARLLALLDAHTELAVPTIYGVVDGDPELPAPYLLMERVGGVGHDRTTIASLDDGDVHALATATGRQLRALHALDVVDEYGYVGVEREQSMAGDRPSTDPSQVVVEGGASDWRTRLRTDTRDVLAALPETRFGDVRASLEPTVERAIDDLEGPFEPVLARIDQSLDNVALDPETGEVAAMLDWEFCVAATPDYDLAFVADSLNGGIWQDAPAARDRRGSIVDGVLEGYREATSAAATSLDVERVVDAFDANSESYELVIALHAMANFEMFCDQFDANEETRRATARGLRERALAVR